MANLTGTESSDLLNGTIESDRISALAGNDTIFGLEGDDWLSGNLGDDAIYANQGNDTAYGGRGKDSLYGGRGNDLLSGNLDDDYINGNADDDTIYGGKGNDTVRGGKGNDRIFGDRGNDILYGDLGSNTLTGGEGNDIFVLGSSGDVLTDFTPGEDRIGLNGLSFSDLSISQGTGQNANNTVITNRLTGAILATLQGVNASSLNANHFTAIASPSPSPNPTPNPPVRPPISSPTPTPALGDPGRTFATAADLGNLSETRSLQQRVDDSDPIDIYKFNLTTPRIFNFSLEGLSADADVTLVKDINNNGEIDPNEILFISEESGTTPEVKNNYLLADGTYYVIVEQYEGDTDYNLSLGTTPPDFTQDRGGNSLATATNLGELVKEINLNDFVGNNDPNDYYRFSLSQETGFAMFLSGLTADADVELIQDKNNNGIVDDGEVIGNSEEVGTDPEYIDVARLAPGTYYVKVSQFDGDTPYQLDLLESRDSAIDIEVFATIDANQTIQGNLESSDPANVSRIGSRKDDYQLTNVIAGQTVTVNLNSSEFDTYLQLVDAVTGEVIAENDDADSSTNSSLSFVVAPNVDYLVRVTSFDPQDGGRGQYTISTQTSSPIAGAVPANNTAANEAINGELNTTDLRNPADNTRYKDSYRLTNVAAGQQIQAKLESTSIDTVLQLVNATTGEVIAENDDSDGSTRNSQLTFTAEAGTEYLLRATSHKANETGNYTLTVVRPDAITATPSLTQNEIVNQIQSSVLKTEVTTRIADNTLDRNDAIAILRAGGMSEGGVDAIELDDLKLLVNNSTQLNMPDAVRYFIDRIVKDSTATTNTAQLESQIGRWFLGKVPPNNVFTDPDPGPGKPRPEITNLTYAELKGPLFGSASEARIGQIDQGSLGDCAFLAALAATFKPQRDDSGNQSSDIVNGMITDNGDDTFTVRFYDDKTLQAQYVTVDRMVAINPQSKYLYGAKADGKVDPNNPTNSATWVPLVERAYAQWREEPGQKNKPGYDAIGLGDNVRDPLTRIVGKQAKFYTFQPGYSNTGDFSTIQSALAAGGMFVTTGSRAAGKDEELIENLIVPGHAYAVTYAYLQGSEQRVVVRNPWGVDSNGGRVIGADDGFIDLAYGDFTRYFPNGLGIG
ncbi:MAG: pre-peptidase C-terminal domain-containing protein [Desertifilum sp.]|nr:pre-peptidase C-terminal domain-containing protein [Desertifilum sp.]